MKPPDAQRFKSSKTSARTRKRKPHHQEDIVTAAFEALTARGRKGPRIIDCKNELTVQSMVSMLLH